MKTSFILYKGKPLDPDQKSLYQQITGSLLYLVNCTRLELCWQVGQLARFMTSPSAEHLQVAKEILRYLAGTINIYPHFVENTSWYKSLEGEDSQEVQPILEIRFMGLRGVFDYMLKEIQATLGLGFFHLDGEALPAD